MGSQPFRCPVPRTSNPIASFCQHCKKKPCDARMDSVARAADTPTPWTTIPAVAGGEGRSPASTQRPDASPRWPSICGRDGLQALTGRSLRVPAVFSLYCQQYQRVKGKPSENRGAVPLAYLSILAPDFMLSIFRSNFFCS
jgi:hypothetical protein